MTAKMFTIADVNIIQWFSYKKLLTPELSRLFLTRATYIYLLPTWTSKKFWTYLFNTCFLSIYYEPDILRGAKFVIEKAENLCFHGDRSLMRNINNPQNKQVEYILF